MKGIIDGFEGDLVVVELNEGETKDFPKTMFPKKAAVGDVILIEGSSITILREETEKMKKEISDLMDDLFD